LVWVESGGVGLILICFCFDFGLVWFGLSQVGLVWVGLDVLILIRDGLGQLIRVMVSFTASNRFYFVDYSRFRFIVHNSLIQILDTSCFR